MEVSSLSGVSPLVDMKSYLERIKASFDSIVFRVPFFNLFFANMNGSLLVC